MSTAPRVATPPVRLDSPVEEQPEVNVPPPRVASPEPVPLPANQQNESSSVPPSPVTHQVHSEEQELRAKIRFMEARRADDVQRIRELETRLSDAEAFVALRPKLQAKLNQLQQESLQTKRELQDQTTELQVVETKLTEANEQLEMVMLDKEVAEERAEAAELELEDLKEKLAGAQDELTVLREASNGSGGGTDASDGRFSLAYIQLERQNGRLKEALLR
jgi:dynactin 1